MSDPLERLKAALAGRYAIQEEAGAGGMATVYLADDLKHDRKVAVKVLRPELAAVLGAERFLNEIKVTANLQHPHILALHDSGEADGFVYYVMPFVDGESLRDRLNREKQLSVEESIDITKAVASALDYAHRHDVVHRDIKPENILLHDGQPVVADFGIALAVSAAGAGTRLTETGMSLGTPHYMSPEQAMGDRELDARSDVYSLGCVAYEMLAGEPPYTGPTAQAIIAKVMTEEPRRLTLQRRTVPPHVDAAILRAIEKLPADRFTAASQFADALTNPSAVTAAPAETLASTAAVATPRRSLAAGISIQPGWLRWAIPAAVLVLALAAIAGWIRQFPEPVLSRFTVALPDGQGVSTNISGTLLAFSPDGSRLVYVGPQDQLFVRDVGQLEARPLPGTEGARAPFFSPDGQWVAFHADNKIKKVALAGSPPLMITETSSDFRGAAWGPGDLVVFTPQALDGLYSVSADGGARTQLTTLDTAFGDQSHRWPTVLPDGNGVVFTIFDGDFFNPTLAVLNLQSGEVQRLRIVGTRPQYAATGHIVYGSPEGSLVAIPFDASTLEVTGGPVSILEGLMVRTNTVSAEFALSPSGSLAYLSSVGASRLSIVLADRSGVEEELIADLALPGAPRFSPDGRRVALELSEGGNQEIWIYDLLEGTMTRLTFEGNNRYPEWTPDGSRVLFTTSREGVQGRALFWKSADGSGDAELLYQADGNTWEGEWLPDGESLITREISTGRASRDLWFVSLKDSTTRQPFVVTEFQERAIALSPDGRWLAYVSDETGRDEVFVRPVPGPGGKRQVSIDGATDPAWSRDGRELFYRSGTHMMAAAIQTEPGLSVGVRQELFEDPYIMIVNRTNFDVSPQDGRFLMIAGATRNPGLVVVLNWYEELRERMGGN